MIILDPTLKPVSLTSERPRIPKLKQMQASIVEGSLDMKEKTPILSPDLVGTVGHMNYLSYLETCWGAHYIPVITPDIIWYTLLCELALEIKKDPEAIRHLFTTSKGKTEIAVPSSDPIRLPIEAIVEQLHRLVPNGRAQLYLPTFSTSTSRSKQVMGCAFADAVSPYYNYSMFMCGFPAIDVRGTQADWESVLSRWEAIRSELPIKETEAVKSLRHLSRAETRADPEFWKLMFKLERCGSGGQTEAFGWITMLFANQPDEPRFVSNFDSHVSLVDYTQLDTDQTFKLVAGLLSSEHKPQEDGSVLLEPQFGSFVVETTKSKGGATKKDEADALEMTISSMSIGRDGP